MYILVLDSSGSMLSNSKWENLLNEARRFIGELEKDPLLKSNSKVTIITYNDDPVLVCENMVPEKKLIDQLKFMSGNTDFE